jgi:hypothetical protein
MMVGRQELHVDVSALERLLREHGRDGSDAGSIFDVASGYAEPFFELIGASEIQSIDASDFEGATVIHDLNLPIPQSLEEQFTVVLDSGTLEHVFNPTMAMRNYMTMASSGGHVLLITPTNNLMGHGFYQFSPDLFYRVFSSENGFEMQRTIVFENYPGARWYQVADPTKVRRRVELRNSWETYIAIQARRTHIAELFRDPPKQSDYAARWGGDAFEYTPSRMRQLIKPLVPGVILRARRRGFKRDVFRPV